MGAPRTVLGIGLTLLAGGGPLAGCGLQVTSADLFVLTRSGPGKPLTLVVNDGGTIRCNGGAARALPDPLLLQARDLASQLDKDAKAKLRTPAVGRGVFTYSVRLQDGTVSFPDTAGTQRHEFALMEQFALQVAQEQCGISG